MSMLDLQQYTQDLAALRKTLVEAGEGWADEGYRLAARRIAVDKLCGSRCAGDPILTAEIDLMTGPLNGYRYDVIHFNNGLHGWHLEDETEYARFYEDFICFLKEEFAGTPIYILLTTFVSDAGRRERVQVRNRVALELAARYDLPVIDLYTPSAEISHLLRDGVHFQEEGNRILAEFLLKEIKKKMGE